MYTGKEKTSLAWPCSSHGGWKDTKRYGELATGSRPAGRPTPRYKDVCKRHLRTGDIPPTDLEALAADRNVWRLTTKSAAVKIEEKLKEQHEMKRQRRRVRAASGTLDDKAFVCPTCKKNLTTRGLGSTATVAVAARPRNDDQGANPLSSETQGCQQQLILILPSHDHHGTKSFLLALYPLPSKFYLVLIMYNSKSSIDNKFCFYIIRKDLNLSYFWVMYYVLLDYCSHAFGCLFLSLLILLICFLLTVNKF